MDDLFQRHCAYPVRSKYLSATQYWLVHASDHLDAHLLMNDEIVKFTSRPDENTQARLAQPMTAMSRCLYWIGLIVLYAGVVAVIGLGVLIHTARKHGWSRWLPLAVTLASAALLASLSFILVGFGGFNTDDGFDWNLASVFGTAIGTVLLASATVAFAWITATLGSEQHKTAIRPLLIDCEGAHIEKTIETVRLRRPGSSGDFAVFETHRGDVVAADDPHSRPGMVEGYLSVPVRNVGAGAAVISSVPRVRAASGSWLNAEVLHRVVPTGELTRFGGAVVASGIRGSAPPWIFEAEIEYTDIGNAQRLLSRFWISLADAVQAPGPSNPWEVVGLEVNDQRSGHVIVRSGSPGRSYQGTPIAWPT